MKIFEAIFIAQENLRKLAPEFKWTGMGNLLGDFGEFMAIQEYELTKAPSGADGYDALTKEGKKVQIKANFSAKQIGIRGEADLLLVLSIGLTGACEEVYYGPFKNARDVANYSSRDNKWMVGIQKLKKLNAAKEIV